MQTVSFFGFFLSNYFSNKRASKALKQALYAKALQKSREARLLVDLAESTTSGGAERPERPRGNKRKLSDGDATAPKSTSKFARVMARAFKKKKTPAIAENRSSELIDDDALEPEMREYSEGGSLDVNFANTIHGKYSKKFFCFKKLFFRTRAG